MSHLRRSARLLFTWLASVLLGSGAALAQDYPNRPVRIIVPFSPGGVADSAARTVADRLGARIGQQLIVENRPGGGGNIGNEFVAKAAPNGYTLLLGFDSTLVINPHVYKHTGFDPIRDFEPVTRLGNSTLILVAHPSLPVKNVQELIKLARQKSGLYYGTGGAGSTAHLAGEFLNERAGIKLQHVPYKGGAQSIVDVVGGHIPLLITAVATSVNYVKDGRLKGLGVLSGKRSPALPDVPTFAESGLPGFEVPSWVGILAPAKTPAAIIEKLHREIVAVLAETDVRDRYAGLGLEPVGNTPAQFGAQIRTELAGWEKVVRNANIRIE